MFSKEVAKRYTGKMLITTDAWFIAPDGKSYCAVWGNVEIVGDEVLGIKTNARSTNWYAIVGSGDKAAVIAGCQIHYAVQSPKKPNTDPVEGWNTQESGGISIFTKPSAIYIAE